MSTLQIRIIVRRRNLQRRICKTTSVHIFTSLNYIKHDRLHQRENTIFPCSLFYSPRSFLNNTSLGTESECARIYVYIRDVVIKRNKHETRVHNFHNINIFTFFFRFFPPLSDSSYYYRRRLSL